MVYAPVKIKHVHDKAVIESVYQVAENAGVQQMLGSQPPRAGREYVFAPPHKKHESHGGKNRQRPYLSLKHPPCATAVLDIGQVEEREYLDRRRPLQPLNGERLHHLIQQEQMDYSGRGKHPSTHCGIRRLHPRIAVGLHLALALHAGVRKGKMLETGLADELSAYLADAVGTVVDPVKSLVDLLEGLVLFTHLTEVLETHEAVASVLILACAVNGLLQRIGLQGGRLADDGPPERDQRLAELRKVGIGELEALQTLLDAVIDGDLPNEKDILIDYIKEHMKKESESNA